MKKHETKIRLLRTHYHNGVKKLAGSVLRVSQQTADWLIGKRRAVAFKSGR